MVAELTAFHIESYTSRYGSYDERSDTELNDKFERTWRMVLDNWPLYEDIMKEDVKLLFKAAKEVYDNITATTTVEGHNEMISKFTPKKVEELEKQLQEEKNARAKLEEEVERLSDQLRVALGKRAMDEVSGEDANKKARVGPVQRTGRMLAPKRRNTPSRAQYVELCKDKGLPTWGTIALLQKRLDDHHKKDISSAVPEQADLSPEISTLASS